MTPVFGERRWLPVACHIFGNVTIVDPKTGEIVLSRSKDREEFTPYGGEINYQDMEQSHEGAAREVREETGGLVNPNPEDLILIDSSKVYPTEDYDPYEGVIVCVDSFIYLLKNTDKDPVVKEQEYEEGCQIMEVIKMSIPELNEKIKHGEIKVFSNFIPTLAKIEQYLKKGN